MNQNQKTVLRVALVVVGLTGLFPPWVYRENMGDGLVLERNAGYICIFTPPSTQDYERIARLFGYEDDPVPPAARNRDPSETEIEQYVDDWTRREDDWARRHPNEPMPITLTPHRYSSLQPVRHSAAEKVAKFERLYRVSIDLPRLLVQLLTTLLVAASVVLALQGPRRAAPDSSD